MAQTLQTIFGTGDKCASRASAFTDLVDSVKFGMLLYTLTYVGSWFSGISLVLIFIIALFTVPQFYEVYKEPVDHYVGIAKENIDKVQHQISDKLPFLKKVPEGEKKEQ
uniref:Reticulon-like protein n=1 Tax=Ditylenchus dipsaci TaxID=166011 RepID=A0A915D930_9BILA